MSHSHSLSLCLSLSHSLSQPRPPSLSLPPLSIPSLSPSVSLSHCVPTQRGTLLTTAGPCGLNGPIVPCPADGACSSAGAPATASITTATARQCRRATATSRSVTSAVSDLFSRSQHSYDHVISFSFISSCFVWFCFSTLFYFDSIM